MPAQAEHVRQSGYSPELARIFEDYAEMCDAVINNVLARNLLDASTAQAIADVNAKANASLAGQAGAVVASTGGEPYSTAIGMSVAVLSAHVTAKCEKAELTAQQHAVIQQEAQAIVASLRIGTGVSQAPALCQSPKGHAVLVGGDGGRVRSVLIWPDSLLAEARRFASEMDEAAAR